MRTRWPVLWGARGGLALATIGVFCTPVLAQPIYSIVEVGLTGRNYTYTTSGKSNQNSLPFAVNSLGDAIGESSRYGTTGLNLGSDAWFYNGTKTIEIGLTGTVYASGNMQDSVPAQLNSTGQVIGYSFRFFNSSTSLGQDAWIFSGGTTKEIGLTGANYSYIPSGQSTPYEASTPFGLNDSGQVAGATERFNASGANLGFDSWFYNGSTTLFVGLTGGNYSYTYTGTGGGTFEYSTPTALNGSGAIIGSANRYSSSGASLGSDAWLYQGGTTQKIGLSGANYAYSASGGTFESGVTNAISDSGKVAGSSACYNASGNSLGNDVWLYNGATTQVINPTTATYTHAFTGTGGGAFENATFTQMNAAGQVIGTANRYSTFGSAEGWDAWIYDGHSTKTIGLTGPNYTPGAGQTNNPMMINSAGDVLGSSDRVTAANVDLGTDVWVYDGNTTRSVGLSGAGYSYSTSAGTEESNFADGMNSSGDAIGETLLYDSAGHNNGSRVGWFYDAQTKTTSVLNFATPGSFAQTVPDVVTDTGAVIGEYTIYSGNTFVAIDLFYWTESQGFSDLGNLVNGGLSPAGWKNLEQLNDNQPTLGTAGITPQDWTKYILGIGTLTNQASGNSDFLLTAVPEPAGVLPLGAGLIGLAFLRPSRGRRADLQAEHCLVCLD